MLRTGLAILGLGVVLASPVLAAGKSRFAMIVEAPWDKGRAETIGREAGGLLVRSGWLNAVFYFPEGARIPGATGTTATIPVKGADTACGSAG